MFIFLKSRINIGLLRKRKEDLLKGGGITREKCLTYLKIFFKYLYVHTPCCVCESQRIAEKNWF